MPTLEEVKKQLEMLDGVSRFLGRREIKELPDILWEDENVERLLQGIYESNNGILVATNKRVIFVDKSLLGSLRVEDFPYDKISSIQYKVGVMFGKMTIFSSGNKAVISQVDKKLARVFGDYVRAKITSKTEHSSVPNSESKSQDNDVISKLERLADLKEKGILSEEEFIAQKKKILK